MLRFICDSNGSCSCLEALTIHTKCSAIGILSNEQADVSYPKLAVFTDVAKCINIVLSISSAICVAKLLIAISRTLHGANCRTRSSTAQRVQQSSMMGSKQDIASLINGRVVSCLRLQLLQCKVYERQLQSQAMKSQSLQQIRSGLCLCSLQKVATLAAVMKRSRAKSAVCNQCKDITALMHVTYC